MEYKPLVPTPRVLGGGGLVRSWQEIGTLSLHGTRRRLTETERLSIAREWAEGVPAQALAERYGVSRMSIYNAVNRGKARQETGNRPLRMLGVRLSERELMGFDAALTRRGITRRQDAMRRLTHCCNPTRP